MVAESNAVWVWICRRVWRPQKTHIWSTKEKTPCFPPRPVQWLCVGQVWCEARHDHLHVLGIFSGVRCHFQRSIPICCWFVSSNISIKHSKFKMLFCSLLTSIGSIFASQVFGRCLFPTKNAVKPKKMPISDDFSSLMMFSPTFRHLLGGCYNHLQPICIKRWSHLVNG